MIAKLHLVCQQSNTFAVLNYSSANFGATSDRSLKLYTRVSLGIFKHGYKFISMISCLKYFETEMSIPKQHTDKKFQT